MRFLLISIAALVFTTSCSQHEGASGPSPVDDVQPQAAAIPAKAPQVDPYAGIGDPVASAANYDARDGNIYSYIGAISEDQRKEGVGAGDAFSFAYLGIRDGRYTLAQVGQNNIVLNYATCSRPCTIIRVSDGRQIGYSENSIIGAAFADAIAGRLVVASEAPANSPAKRTPDLNSSATAADDVADTPTPVRSYSKTANSTDGQ